MGARSSLTNDEMRVAVSMPEARPENEATGMLTSSDEGESHDGARDPAGG
ncbi:MAG: hypothetical protein MUE69_23760 [Myxococcota bacterium]|nr:hypothetical protein [Myxococcota bacterium]